MLTSKTTYLVEKTIFRNKFYSNLLDQARIKKVKKTWEPDITISRDPGSGGRPIAKLVAKKLDWNYYDKRIFKEIAQEMEVPKHIVEMIDESPKFNLIINFLLNFFSPNFVSETKYLTYLKKLIIKAGQEKDAVFLGRGANHIIPRNKALHVRIIAPLETRIQNTQKHENKTLEEAENQVKKTESARKKFIKQYFNCKLSDPNNFDIILNTQDMPIETASEIIISAFHHKFSHSKNF